MEEKALWQPKAPDSTRMWQFITYIVQKAHCPRLLETVGNLGAEAKSLHAEGAYYESCYQALHAWSVENPALFWRSLCDFLGRSFDGRVETVLNNYQTMLDAVWFAGAKLNFAQQLLSRQDSQVAIVSINEAGDRKTLTYAQLYSEVAGCIAGLQALGVGVGDRVAAVMPNTAQTIIAMLATTALGAIWSSCSSDFGAQSVMDRLGQVEPKVLFICDGHQYQGKIHNAADKIASLHEGMPSLTRIILCNNINQPIANKGLPKLLAWEDFIRPAKQCQFVSLPFNHPVYIVFSSGTTGKPKCIVHGAGGTLMQHLKELALHTDIREQDILCFYTTCGWMMWNWSVSALALGARLILYEGAPNYPAKDSLMQVVAKEKATVFGTSAKYLLAIDKDGVKPKKNLDLAALRCILSTGSPLLPKSYEFVYEQIKKDVQLSSISGGTDILSCFALGNPILPVYQGALQCLGLGMAVAVFDEVGKAVVEEQGELVCTKPFPSMPLYFWQDQDKKLYQKAYFERYPGIWSQGDFASMTRHQGLIIYGRSDAVLNPGGVRIGTAEIYRQVELVDAVVDSVVIAQPWEDDLRIVLFVKLREGLQLTENLIQEIKQTIRHNTSPRHVPAKIVQVGDIPRTINGKVVELAVRQVVLGEAVNNLRSLANPEALEQFKNRAELQ
jgi:acetoacetyl-CoA synthetase